MNRAILLFWSRIFLPGPKHAAGRSMQVAQRWCPALHQILVEVFIRRKFICFQKIDNFFTKVLLFLFNKQLADFKVFVATPQ